MKEVLSLLETLTMKEVLSLLETLVWPAFILLILYLGRQSVVKILEAIQMRIEAGDPFEAGTSGVKLGPSARRAAPVQGDAESTAVAAAAKPSPSKETPSETGDGEAAETRVDSPENPGIYLVHKARRDKSLDRGEYEYYRLRAFLEVDEEELLERVSHVIYHLHPSFIDRDRTIRDPATQFELRTAAWGQFLLTADVHLKGEDQPLRLDRYLNF